MLYCNIVCYTRTSETENVTGAASRGRKLQSTSVRALEASIDVGTNAEWRRIKGVRRGAPMIFLSFFERFCESAFKFAACYFRLECQRFDLI